MISLITSSTTDPRILNDLIKIMFDGSLFHPQLAKKMHHQILNRSNVKTSLVDIFYIPI
jgi:hypothetical protein